MELGISAALSDGIVIMLIGMGVVFSFLVILVFAMIIMSKVVIYLNKIFPELVEVPVVKKVATDDEAVAVAVLAAVLKK